ncbi:MAG: hypothetical protein ISR78_08360 [Spirochaetia bacterium]|nr:hypothetical protein [Spirochaetia bacterium]
MKTKKSEFILMLLVCSLCTGVLPAFGETAPSPRDDDSCINLLVTIETTSDHTTVIFTDDNPIVFASAVWFEPEAAFSISGNDISLQQPIENAVQNHQCKVKYFIQIQKPANELVNFYIDRGHLGKTTVDLQPFYFSGNKFVDEPQSFIWNGKQQTDPNTQLYAVPTANFTPWHWGNWEDYLINYPLNQLVESWKQAILAQKYDDTIYWDDAIHITHFSAEEYIEQSAEMSFAEPNDFDPGQMQFAAPIYQYDRSENQIYIFLFGYYQGFQFSDSLLIEERDYEYKIRNHLLRPGVDFPGDEHLYEN